MDGVSPDTCEANRAALTRGIDHNADEVRRVDRTTEKRLDAHARDIDKLNDTLNNLSATQKVLASTQEKLADMQREHDQRLRVLEDAETKKATVPAKKWWETEIGKTIIKFAGILLLILLVAALGHGWIDDFGKVFGVLPK